MIASSSRDTPTVGMHHGRTVKAAQDKANSFRSAEAITFSIALILSVSIKQPSSRGEYT
jgi:hypothetical protein